MNFSSSCVQGGFLCLMYNLLMEEVLFKNKIVLYPLRVRCLIICKFSCDKNKKKPTKNPNSLNMPFHVLHNTDYKISPYLSKRFTAYYKQCLINGEIYNQSCLIATFNLSDISPVPARVSQPMSLTRNQYCSEQFMLSVVGSFYLIFIKI
jgi:hypothetical protein